MNTYNEWTILEFFSENGRSRCRARCSCGTIRETDKWTITSGKSKMCRTCSNVRLNGGPQEHRRIKGDHLAAMDKFNDYKVKAKKRGIEFNLDFDTFKKVAKQNCYYCDEPPSNVNKIPKKEWADDFVYSGLDRLDNSIGYQSDNVLPCCKYCNYMKRELTYEDFFRRVAKISSKWPPGSVIIPVTRIDAPVAI